MFSRGSRDAMPANESCTEDEIRRLVDDFYGRARADPLLGPIFEAHVDEWGLHLAKMVDFWSTALRGTARYRGLPMPIHVALPDLNVELFQRWLSRDELGARNERRYEAPKATLRALVRSVR